MYGPPGHPPSEMHNDNDDIVLASLADGPSIGPPQAKPRRWGARLSIVVIALLVLGPLLWRWLPTEIARWYAASAMEKHLEGDAEAAEQDFQNALRWDPQSAAIHRQSGDFHAELGQYEQAVDFYSRAVELDATDPLNLMQRSVALQHLERHSEAIRDWEEIVDLLRDKHQTQEAIALNGLAYARALGNTELDLALDEVNQALQFAGPNPAMLDTRGYIQFLRGDYQAARHDLDRAVDSMETQLAAVSQIKSYSDSRQHELDIQQMQQSTAVLRYHRALALEHLGEAELADRDLQRVKQLGFEPGDDLF